MELNALLWTVFHGLKNTDPLPLPSDGRVSFKSKINMPDNYWSAIGYYCLEKFAVRVDVFERIFFLVRQKLKSGPFLESSDLMNPIGCNSQQLTNLLSFCGCKGITLGDEKNIFFNEQKKAKKFNKKDYDLSLDEILKKKLPTDPIIFDVGANKGQSIEKYLKLFGNPTIHSFEPIKEEINKLEKKISK